MKASLQILLFISLSLSLPACQSSVSETRSKNLVDEANKLLDQQSQVDLTWSREYGQVFSAEQRAKFPSNRDFLRSRAERLIILLDESSKLGNAAAEKYHQASGLVRDDKKKRGMALFGSAIKKDVETNQLFKEFAQLTSDTTIQDVKTLNERFTHFRSLVEQKRKEKDEMFVEGKRLLGM
jgi:hypothetical protein